MMRQGEGPTEPPRSSRPASNPATLAELDDRWPIPPPPTDALGPPPQLKASPRPWLGRLRVGLIVSDGFAIAVASAFGLVRRFDLNPPDLPVLSVDVPYALLAGALMPLWLVILVTRRAYEPSILGNGSEEYRRVLSAGVGLLVVMAVADYVLHVSIARGFLGTTLPAATVLTIFGRFCMRKALHRSRRRGRSAHRVLVVGPHDEVRDMTCHMHRATWAGYRVVGACCDDATEAISAGPDRVPVLGDTSQVLQAISTSGANVLAMLSAGRPGTLRDIAWALEGSGVDVVVAPAITDIAGPRLSVVPVAGLPIVQVGEPTLSGFQQLIKGCYDRLIAAVVLLIACPILLVAAVLIKLDSRGPVLFRQTRVGRSSRPFTMLKLRTMVDGAHHLRGPLDHLNDGGGPLFKMRADPRRTGVGRFLRRFSIDELPQLWNVLRGEMSLVGPRPPLPEEVETYDKAARRRLLVKPGITGLWQIGGRSELDWEEAVRLDLYYVDHWSPLMDGAILMKTLAAVLRGRGAY